MRNLIFFQLKDVSGRYFRIMRFRDRERLVVMVLFKERIWYLFWVRFWIMRDLGFGGRGDKLLDDQIQGMSVMMGLVYWEFQY